MIPNKIDHFICRNTGPHPLLCMLLRTRFEVHHEGKRSGSSRTSGPEATSCGLLVNHECQLVLPILVGFSLLHALPFLWVGRIEGSSCLRYILVLSYLMRCSRAELPSMHWLTCKANRWGTTSQLTIHADHAGPMEEWTTNTDLKEQPTTVCLHIHTSK